MKSGDLILYRRMLNDGLLSEMVFLKEKKRDEDTELSGECFFRVAGGLIEKAEEYGFFGNLWKVYITFLLAVDENPYSLALEMRSSKGNSLISAAVHDMEYIKELFDHDGFLSDPEQDGKLCALITDYQGDDDRKRIYDKGIRDRIQALEKRLEGAKDGAEFAKVLGEYYTESGTGQYGLYKSFRLSHDRDGVEIVPIICPDDAKLSDLIGYELQKERLKENTEAFLNGRSANNCLLYGAAGTGKSSSIKGILNEYHDRGLRMIELYKHEFRELPFIMEKIRRRNYRFIIYMDDLSFEDFETEYKHLKAVIEGGLEKKPENVLIYATSNRRHLIRENFSDRSDSASYSPAYGKTAAGANAYSGGDDIHRNDTVQEKLSLAYRFGISIYFGSPDKKEFNHIVKSLAKRYNINMDEDRLLMEANRWELSNGGLSGRTAKAFIDYLGGAVDL
ncbi:MAG: ATP-binding protein [Lachnospiraceae bacterium]|nr:ATP-binding protein [Lachnospiraceae bacterium]